MATFADVTITSRASSSGDRPSLVLITGNQKTEVQVPPTLYDAKQEADIRWYLEDYAIKEPFERLRAEAVAATIAGYKSRLSAITIAKLPASSHSLQVTGQNSRRLNVRDDDTTSHIHQLHWEALEAEDAKCLSQGLIVTREVETDSRPVNIDVPVKDGEFQICLVVARPEAHEEDAIEVSDHGAVSRLLNSSISSGVQLHIVRPGTFEALKAHLQNARERRQPPHIVHLDLHGMVHGRGKHAVTKLRFSSSEGGDDLRTAEEIGHMLASHGVQVVILNACQSAHAAGPDGANLARVLIKMGIKFVLAMSYKLMTASMSLLVSTFYERLLLHRDDLRSAAAAARRAMRLSKLRPARFGMHVEVDDWLVPVAYAAAGHTVTYAWRSQPATKRHIPTTKPQSITPMSPKLHHPVGRDTFLLNLEMQLLHKCNLIQIYGPSGCGKTCIGNYLQDWWQQTGFIRSSILLNISLPTYNTPLGCCKEFVVRLRRLIGAQLMPIVSGHSQERQRYLRTPDQRFQRSLADLSNVLQSGEFRTGLENRRLLIILDELELSDAKVDRFHAQIVKHTAASAQWAQLLSVLQQQTQLLTLVLCRESFILEHVKMELVEMPGLAAYSAHALLQQTYANSSNARTQHAIVHTEGILPSQHSIKALDELVGRLQYLPGCISILSSFYESGRWNDLEVKTRSGEDIIGYNTTAESILKQDRLFDVCEKVWLEAKRFEKIFMLGLGLFAGPLPMSYKDFVLHLLKWDCYPTGSDLPITELLHRTPCDPCRRQIWDRVLEEVTNIANPQREVAYEMFDEQIQLASRTILSLRRKGLIYVSGLDFGELNSAADLVEIVESGRYTISYTAHPVFTLFMRRELGQFRAQSVSQMRNAYVDYHEWRALPPLSQQHNQTLSLALSDPATEAFHTEVLKNSYAYLDVLDVAVTHKTIAFPFEFIASVTDTKQVLVWPSSGIKDSTMAQRIARVLDGILVATHDHGTICPAATLQRLSDQHDHRPSEQARVQVLATLIYLSNWHSRFLILQSDTRRVSEQLKVSQDLAAQARSLSTNTSLADQDIAETNELIAFVNGGCQNISQFMGSLGTQGHGQQIDLIKLHTLILEMTSLSVNLQPTVADGTFNRQPDSQSEDSPNLVRLIHVLREIASLLPALIEASKSEPAVATILQLFGVQTVATETDSYVEDVKQMMGPEITMEFLQDSMSWFLDLIDDINNGATDAMIEKKLRKPQKKLLEKVQAPAHMNELLEVAIEQGDTHNVILWHETRMRQFVTRQDWAGLKLHLDLTWNDERNKSAEELTDTEIRCVSYWHLAKGSCEYYLADIPTALGHYIEGQRLAARLSPQLDVLQFKCLIQIANIGIQRGLGLRPVWDTIMQALCLAYSHGGRAFYPRDGTLFSDLFSQLQMNGQNQEEHIALSEAAIAPLSSEMTKLFGIFDDLGLTRTADIEELKKSRVGVSSVSIKQELDSAFLILNRILIAERPLTCKSYQKWRRKVYNRADRRTQEDLETIKGLRRLFMDIQKDLEDLVQGQEREGGNEEAVKASVSKLYKQIERTIFQKNKNNQTFSGRLGWSED